MRVCALNAAIIGVPRGEGNRERHSSVLCVGTKGYRSEELLKLLPGCRCSTATIKVLLSLAHNVDQLTQVAKGETVQREGRWHI